MKVTSLSTIYVNIIHPLYSHSYSMQGVGSLGKYDFFFLRRVRTDMMALNLVGSKKEPSAPDVLRSHIWGTSGPFRVRSLNLYKRTGGGVY